MSQNWTANLRTEEGKGASRRLRHANKVPAIIYGAGKEAVSVSLLANFVKHAFEDETVFNTVLTIDVEGGESEGVKAGGMMSFLQSTVEVSCLAKDLPVEIIVDVSAMEAGTSMRLSELTMPEGVAIRALAHGNSDYDQSVVSISKAKAR